MKTFVTAAIVGVGGALVALPWGEIMSAQTAGVVVVALSGIVATLKALYTPAPETKSE